VDYDNMGPSVQLVGAQVLNFHTPLAHVYCGQTKLLLSTSKMAAVRHLRLVMHVLEPPTKGVFIAVQNLVGIDAVVSIICNF